VIQPGRLLYRVRAGEKRSPFTNLVAPDVITVRSSAFADGEPMPRYCAGNGVGEDRSPPLCWTGLPAGTQEVVLVLDDIDVPLPRPLLHTVAVIDPIVDHIAAGALQPGTAGMRFLPAAFGRRGYAGPRPIPGHGPHRYRFQVFATDNPVPCHVTTTRALLAWMRGALLGRGMLTGTYRR
jgi:phosphatidylethanolamine-binding protein (PEBP) family uncharacterized protein